MPDRPLCPCHTAPMLWHKDRRSPAGGYWRCYVAVREQSQRWAAAHPEKILESRLRTEAAHREQRRAKNRRYYWDNRDKMRAQNRALRLNNPEGERVRNRRRRARLAQVPHEPFTREEIWDRDQGLCYLCGESVALAHVHTDHVRPVVAGGPDIAANVAATHPSCNQSKKGTWPLSPWMERAVATRLPWWGDPGDTRPYCGARA